MADTDEEYENPDKAPDDPSYEGYDDDPLCLEDDPSEDPNWNSTDERMAQKKAVEAGYLFLQANGIEPTPDMCQQLSIFIEAVALYQERDKQYGPVWRKYGALSNLLRSAAKVERMIELWWKNPNDEQLHKEPLDDAYDLMNYVAFFVRNVGAGNLRGENAGVNQ